MAKGKSAPATGRTLADDSEIINACWWGDGGTGKTTAMAMLSQIGKVIAVDAERGFKKRPLTELGAKLENIEPFRDISIEGLTGLLERVRSELDDDPDSIAGVLFDSVPMISARLLNPIVAESYRKTLDKGRERGEYDVYLEDHGTLTQQLRTVLFGFRDLPCHTGWSALERRDVDDDGAVRYGPQAGPAFQTDMFAYLDIIIHTEVMELEDWNEDNECFIGIPRKVGKYRSKDRFKALPRKMVEPTFPRVIAYVNGELDAETDPLQQRVRDLIVKQQQKQAQKAAAAAKKS